MLQGFQDVLRSYYSPIQQPIVTPSPPTSDVDTKVAWCIYNTCITAFTISLYPQSDALSTKTTKYYHLDPVILGYGVTFIFTVLLASYSGRLVRSASAILLGLINTLAAAPRLVSKVPGQTLRELQQVPVICRSVLDWLISCGKTSSRKLAAWIATAARLRSKISERALHELQQVPVIFRSVRDRLIACWKTSFRKLAIWSSVFEKNVSLDEPNTNEKVRLHSTSQNVNL